MPSDFEDQVKADVKTYAQALVQCLHRDLFDDHSREAAVGALAYFVDEHDLVADNVPTVGLLDDALALVGAAKLLGEVHELGAPLHRDRVLKDFSAYEEHSKMMMTNLGEVTLGSLAAQGRRVSDLEELLDKVNERLAEI